jgi:cold shock CspA family protein
MPTGTIYKYNTNRKFSIIRPDQWKSGLIDVLFETQNFKCKLGDKVEYDQKFEKGKRYAENIKKIG